MKSNRIDLEMTEKKELSQQENNHKENSRLSELLSENLGISGVKPSCDINVHLLRRWSWRLLLIGAVVIFGFLAYNRLQSYLKHEKVIIQDTKKVDELPFPTVTICNNNYFRLSKVMTLSMSKTSSGKSAKTFRDMVEFVSDLQTLIDSLNTTDLSTYTEQFSDKYGDTLKAYPWNFIEQVGYTVNDLVLSCTYDKQDCNNSDGLTMIRTDAGFCVVFNKDGNYVETVSGSSSGLSMLLNTVAEDYIQGEDRSYGFRVRISNPGSVGMFRVRTTSTAIDADNVAKLSMQYQTHEDLAPPYGTCSDSTEEDVDTCLLKCMSTQIQEICGCTDVYFTPDVRGNASICSFEKWVKCVLPREETLINTINIYNCNCTTKCEYHEYAISKSIYKMSNFAIQSLLSDGIIPRLSETALQLIDWYSMYLTLPPDVMQTLETLPLDIQQLAGGFNIESQLQPIQKVLDQVGQALANELSILGVNNTLLSDIIGLLDQKVLSTIDGLSDNVNKLSKITGDAVDKISTDVSENVIDTLNNLTFKLDSIEGLVNTLDVAIKTITDTVNTLTSTVNGLSGVTDAIPTIPLVPGIGKRRKRDVSDLLNIPVQLVGLSLAQLQTLPTDLTAMTKGINSLLTENPLFSNDGQVNVNDTLEQMLSIASDIKGGNDKTSSALEETDAQLSEVIKSLQAISSALEGGVTTTLEILKDKEDEKEEFVDGVLGEIGNLATPLDDLTGNLLGVQNLTQSLMKDVSGVVSAVEDNIKSLTSVVDVAGIESHVVRLNVYYQRMEKETYKQTPTDSLIALFCDTGGCLGLCLGGSILTLVELLDVTCLFFGVCCKSKYNIFQHLSATNVF